MWQPLLAHPSACPAQVSRSLLTSRVRQPPKEYQRTPWGGGKKRGEENLTNDTPPKKGFCTFSTPSGVRLCCSCTKNRRCRTEALLEGSKNYRESAFSGTFSSPHTFCTPPYHGPRILGQHPFPLYREFWKFMRILT